MKYIDNFLNKITMYKLVLWGLSILVVISVIFAFFKPELFPDTSLHMIESVVLLFAVCGVVNTVFAKLYKVQTNTESAYITALILFFVLMPITSVQDAYVFVFVAFVAMASKYVLALNKKHIFNPVAIALFVSALFGSGLGTWWIGNGAMFVFVAVLGFLVLRKLKRFQMFGVLVLTSLLSTIVTAFSHGLSVQDTLLQAIVSGPLLFFASIMFTEPLTTPPQKNLQLIYGVVVGALFGSQFSVGPVYSTPQFALIVGNIFSYFVSPRARLVLTLVEKNKLPGEVYDFVWEIGEKFHFKPGQYLEWTLGHEKPDSRGNRRYFTIASSPTEKYLHLGAKFYPNPSSFKTKLNSLVTGDKIIASQLSGDFVMPDGMDKKLVFIAGGIGVTPFRSMAKYLIDAHEHRDVVLLYSNRTPKDIAYKEVFDEAEAVGVKTIHVVNDLAGTVASANMKVGMINAELIQKEIPDFTERIFYISGPHGMVTAFQDSLGKLGVPDRNIKTDFFPGFV